MKKIFKGKVGVYSVRNLKNNKRYIGSSSYLKSRKSNHFFMLKNNVSDHVFLQEDYNKFGRNNFIFEVLEYCGKENLVEREQVWLDFYKSYERSYGYNSSVTAGKVTHTEKGKNSIINAQKGNTNNKGKNLGKHSEEARQKHSERMIGNTNWLGKKHSEETKKKMSESIKLALEKKRLKKLEELKNENINSR